MLLIVCALTGKKGKYVFLNPEYCFQGNATVDETNNSWQTPLHTASYEAAFDCIQLLVKHGEFTETF